MEKITPAPKGAAVTFQGDEPVAVIGAGRVGISLGLILKRAGHKIVGCSARTPDSLERAAAHLGCLSTTNVTEAIRGAEVIVVSVPDDSIAGVAEELSGAVVASTFVFHTSGALGLAPLGPLAAKGAHTLAIHVLQSIPDPESGPERIPGSYFGVTCSRELRDWAGDLVEQIGGQVFLVDEEDRVAYHAAAAIASNFTVTLASLVEETGMDLDPYLPLMRGTLENLESLGAAKALTGPVVRGDAGTVRRHLDVLAATAPEVAEAYRILARATLRAAMRAGRISPEAAGKIAEALGGGP